jgi:hypothetical protein
VAVEDKELNYSSFVQLGFFFINELFIKLFCVPTDRDMMISRSLLVWIFFALAAATNTFDGNYIYIFGYNTIISRDRAKSRTP